VITLLPYMSQLSRKCGSLGISQLYGSLQPATMITLYFLCYWLSTKGKPTSFGGIGVDAVLYSVTGTVLKALVLAV
jgi:hypothetical protein